MHTKYRAWVDDSSRRVVCVVCVRVCVALCVYVCVRACVRVCACVCV
jgi:hypothetical protein